MKKKLRVSESISLHKVQMTYDHIDFLYRLLSLRSKKKSISHKNLPEFNLHKSFVLSKPYRYWFIIEEKQNYIGSAYISRFNNLGIHLIKPKKSILHDILIFLLNNVSPMKEIPSVRSKNFVINLSTKNKMYLEVVKRIGGKKLQETYSFEKKF